jgi:hypothetical protein
MNSLPVNSRLFSAVVFGLALTLAASAQDAPAAPASAQAPAAAPVAAPAHPHGGGGGQGQGQRGGRVGWGGWGGGWGGVAGGGGVAGTVTEAAADHYTIKTDAGEIYVVHFSVNTQILKQIVQRSNPGKGSGERGAGGGNREDSEPQIIKSGEIKAGDAIGAMGEVNAAAKSVGATHILLIDPERARQMREMQANYGKTWLMGKVTAVDGVKVTLLGGPDSTAHAFVADESTTFRKRREPITLADIQVGDMVRVEGAVKDGIFLAASVSVMGMQSPPPSVPRDAAPAPQSK